MHRDEIVAVKNLGQVFGSFRAFGQVNFLVREQEFLWFIGLSDSKPRICFSIISWLCRAADRIDPARRPS